MIENPQHFNLITNFEEITSRPNFVEKVTIARGEDVQNTISDLVGFYVLRDFVSCGISSCGKKHQKVISQRFMMAMKLSLAISAGKTLWCEF